MLQADKGLKVAEAIGKDVCTFLQCSLTDEDQVRPCSANVPTRPSSTWTSPSSTAYSPLTCEAQGAHAMAELPTRGSIVCTTKWTDYVMSKHVVVGLVWAACRQRGEHEIRVNSMSPYEVATPMTCWKYEMEAAEVEQAFDQFSPLKVIVLKVKHIAEAVLYLASDESAFVSRHDTAYSCVAIVSITFSFEQNKEWD
ncbi:(+)-cis,trans-nepetalactol synthase NEPS2-like [Diospyros lotus]|uniref:(+)-cis,trans-nepetalactol synthase NEPS2-like n=1 Tax=Diospyros lotus TaxID=55363 RepID=UPI0022505F30|nr:(+)-cis,trans-nepetalactol synthase NEPS2-like [Diospyros lotus]